MDPREKSYQRRGGKGSRHNTRAESWELTPLITSRESKLEIGQSLPSVTVSSGRLHVLPKPLPNWS